MDIRPKIWIIKVNLFPRHLIRRKTWIIKYNQFHRPIGRIDVVHLLELFCE